MLTAFTLLWALSMFAEFAAVARLIVTGLWRKYPALLFFLAVDGIGNIVVWLAGGNRALHAELWRIAAPASWAAQSLMAASIWRRWASRYNGIGWFGLFAASVFTLAAVAVSLLLAGYDYHQLAWSGSNRNLYAIRRGLMSMLAGFLFLVVIFVRHFPVDVSRNLVIYTRTAAIFCGSLAAQSFLHNAGGIFLIVAQFGLVLICLGSFVAWGMLLTPAGEVVIEAPRIDPELLARFDETEKNYMQNLRAGVAGLGSRGRPPR